MHTLRLGARCLRPTWVTFFFVQARAGDRRNRGCKGTQRFYGFSRRKTFSFKDLLLLPLAPPMRNTFRRHNKPLLHYCMQYSWRRNTYLLVKKSWLRIHLLNVRAEKHHRPKNVFFPLYDHRTLRQKYRQIRKSWMGIKKMKNVK